MEIPLKYLAPELVIFVTAALTLLVGLFRADKVRRLSQIVALFGLAAALLIAWLTPDWAPSADELSRQFFNPQYITLLACSIGILSILASWNMPFKNDPAVTDTSFRGEYFALMLCSLAGVSMVAKVNDLVWLFLVLELVSIPTYIMVATGRSQAIAQEAGVKYFFLGALAAAVYLFGFSYLYGYAGSTRFDLIAQRLLQDLTGPTHTLPVIGLIGVIFVLIGVAYKIAAVPLHFYTPDVYQGSATPVTAYLAFAPKAAGMVAFIKILSLTPWQNYLQLDPATSTYVFSSNFASAIVSLLTVMAMLTMTIGNVLALLQRNLKRILAYSSIAHSGYMLVGLVAGPGLAGDSASNGISATIFYLAAYSLMNLGAFAVLIYLQGKVEAAEDVDDIAGLSKAHPLAALALALCLFSLIGMPGTIGFLGKVYLVQAALANGHRLLALITVLNAAVAAAYYLRIIASMYLREPWIHFTPRTSWAPRLAAAFCALAVLFFFLFPTPLLANTSAERPTATKPVATQSQTAIATQQTHTPPAPSATHPIEQTTTSFPFVPVIIAGLLLVVLAVFIGFRVMSHPKLHILTPEKAAELNKTATVHDVGFGSDLVLCSVQYAFQEDFLKLTFVWQSLREMKLDHRIGVHFLDAESHICFQADFPQDYEKQVVPAHTLWRDDITVPRTHLRNMHSVGILVFVPGYGLPVSREPRDFSNQRFLIPITQPV